jgi:hypothetical protein
MAQGAESRPDTLPLAALSLSRLICGRGEVGVTDGKGRMRSCCLLYRCALRGAAPGVAPPQFLEKLDRCADRIQHLTKLQNSLVAQASSL